MNTKTTDTVSYDASVALVLANRAQTALTGATDFVIDSTSMYDIASDDLRQVKTLQKEVEDKRTTITGPLNLAVRAVNDLFRAPKEYLEQAESVLKRAMVGWTTEQQRISAEARRVAEEATRKERERLAAIEREAQEAARKAQEEAQAAAKAGDAIAAALALATAREAQERAATAAITASVTTIAPTVAEPAKVSGISGRVTYKAEVSDLMELIKAVAAGEAPIEAVMANDKFLGAQARAFKRPGALYPGVKSVEEHGIAARAA